MNLEDTVEQKPAIKTRILVTSFLALAAIGTHWLPGRTIVATEPEPQATLLASTDKLATGPNSILGDAVADQTSQSLASSADLSQDHLDVDSVVDQAGLSRLLKSVAPLSNEFAVTSGNDSIGGTNAVPEPRTAGLLLLAAAPVLVRRKSRTAS